MAGGGGGFGAIGAVLVTIVGTVSWPSQEGHFDGTPAYLSSAEIFLLQWGQLNFIMMMGKWLLAGLVN